MSALVRCDRRSTGVSHVLVLVLVPTGGVEAEVSHSLIEHEELSTIQLS